MKYGLIGGKLGHSFSKEIHQNIADYVYELKEICPEDIPLFLEKREFEGINVTIPYKETVIPHLDFVSEKAERIGAVNTVVKRDGKLYGDNTDYDGVQALIKHLGLEIKDKKCLILGTGGTSKTVFAVLSDLGASVVLKASRRKAEGVVTYEEALKNHTDCNIIVNTTPVGMYPKNDEAPIDIAPFTALEGVIDVVFNPIETKLVRVAKERGLKSEGGLYMLVAQAVYASAQFINSPLDETLITKVYDILLRMKKNIVLCGMPSCGKSSIGKKLAELTGRTFYDLDSVIVERSKMKISDIFEKYGEARFRGLEKEITKEISALTGVIISCGGGTVIDPENVDFLRQNGEIFFIDRDLDLLIATDDRPMSRDREALEARYKERYPIYNSVCNYKIEGNGTVDEVSNIIYEAYLK